MRQQQRGMAMSDLLVVLLVLMVFGVAAIAARTKILEDRLQIACAKNLKQIGMAFMLYSNENKGSFPRTPFAADTELSFFTGADVRDPFAKNDTLKPNDLTAAVFLLIRTQDISADVFVCPSTTDVRDPMDKRPADERSNFSTPGNLSYSVAHMYPSDALRGKGYKTFIAAFSSDFPLAADINPGGDNLLALRAGKSTETELFQAKTPNHTFGQNVLYADGHAEFQTTPLCGIENDNIYTFGVEGDKAAGIVGEPVGPLDSVLLPTVRHHRTDKHPVVLRGDSATRPTTEPAK